MTVDVIEVDVVQEYLPVREVVEATQQTDEGALTRAGRADDGELLSRADREGDPTQDRITLLVREMHVVEANLATQALGQLAADCSGSWICSSQSMA